MGYKRLTAILTACTLLLGLAGCSFSGGSSAAPESSGNQDPVTSPVLSTDASEPVHVTDPETGGEPAEGDFIVKTDVTDGYSVSGKVYTFTKGGTFTLSGVLEEGQLVVDAKDQKVILELGGVTLTNSSTAVINGVAADRLSIHTVKGSYNEITDARALRADGDEDGLGGAIYAKCDLTLTGEGTLIINAGYNNGVHTTKDLTVKKLTLKVTAPNNALKGKDSVEIDSGSLILISTGGDGIKTEATNTSSKGKQRGSVNILGGLVDIYAACDGIYAACDIEINGAEAVVNVYTGSYSEYSGNVVSAGTKFYIIVGEELYKKYDLYAFYYNGDGTDEAAGKWVKAAFDSECYSRNGFSYTTYYAHKLSAPSAYASVAFYAVETGAEPSLSAYAAKTKGMTVSTSMNSFMVSSFSGNTLSGDYVNLGSSGGSTVSSKGLKAGSSITLAAGSLTVKSTDDGLHANMNTMESGMTGSGDILIKGGTLTLTSGDDGLHADNTVTIEDGTVNIVNSHEGIEANVVMVAGGTTYVYGDDDGINACAGAATPLIKVTGGYLQVRTPSGDTDAIDSNGSYEQTGGFVLVLGGSSSGMVAGSVDVENSLTVTGGTIVALGGICEYPSGGDNCCTVVMSSQSLSDGSYKVEDAAGKAVIEFTVEGNYKAVWMSSELLETGGSYTLAKDGSEVYSWTQSSQLEGASGSGGGFPGGPGGGFPGGGPGGRR